MVGLCSQSPISSLTMSRRFSFGNIELRLELWTVIADITKLSGLLLVYHSLGKIEGRVLVLVDMTHTPD